jgi:hypothetical protein
MKVMFSSAVPPRTMRSANSPEAALTAGREFITRKGSPPLPGVWRISSRLRVMLLTACSTFSAKISLLTSTSSLTVTSS